MRFFSDGPNIPDALLEKRDQGRVVFLCGAGISNNAGMPLFGGLAQKVIDFFDPPASSEIAKAFDSQKEEFNIPLDQVFHLLHLEYPREEVNAVVAEQLKIDNTQQTISREHQIIAKLSADQDGKPQIVTTNFDRLFEALPEFANTSDVEPLKIYEPPAVPNIHLGMSITGLTYLHGRLQEPGSKRHPYILSSADLGRAYLAEAWATNFIRALLNSYTVVLLGYQAEDPPVKYLLQGLNHDSYSNRSNLYAFDEGRPEDIEAKWLDKGVSAIAYQSQNTQHSNLWDSLEAWAERAENPRQWRRKIVDLAENSPRELTAHERGQVVHLVRSTVGAKLFAEANPVRPAEWLCVFDAKCRTAKEVERDPFDQDEEIEFFYPLAEYGLDDDPPRSSEKEQFPQLMHDHILQWRQNDTSPHSSHRLDAYWADLPTRLNHLAHWIVRCLDSPISAWWAWQQNGLHPRLIDRAWHEFRRRNDLHPNARHSWNLVLEYQSDERNFFRHDHAWYELQDRVNKEGWSQSVIQGFATACAPMITRDKPFGIKAVKPPTQSWDETGLHELANIGIKFLSLHNKQISVSNAALKALFPIIEGHFRRASALCQDLKPAFFDEPTCYPKREVKGRIYHREATFDWFLALFDQLSEFDPATARAHAMTWPFEDEYYFRPLKLYAWNKSELFAADEAADSVLKLNQTDFWDAHITRELLFLLHDRWDEFSQDKKDALVARLFEGPSQKDIWSDEKYSIAKNKWASGYAKWLILQGRSFSPDQMNRLNSMISDLPDWDDDWALSMTQEYHARMYRVSTDESPSTLISTPINNIVQKAESETKRDRENHTKTEPFTGLVKLHPRRALASLSHAAKTQYYPEKFWRELIENWPKNTQSRLFTVFIKRLARLPNDVIWKLRHTLSYWIKKHFGTIYQLDPTIAWELFDHLISGLTEDKNTLLFGEDDDVWIDGELQTKSTYGKAFNSPLGLSTRGLLTVLDSLKLNQGEGIPSQFTKRIEYSMFVFGENSNHTIAILTCEINKLYYIAPEWVMENLVPMFDFEHLATEAAWSGYLAAAQIPQEEVGCALKPLLLDLFPKIYQWNWETDNLTGVAAQTIVLLATLESDKPNGLTTKEARKCLREMKDENRRDALHHLGRIGSENENGWSNYVIPFINNVWPREKKFRTSMLSEAWLNLLDDTGDAFPDVLQTVHKFLVPIQNRRLNLYFYTRDNEKSLTTRYPEAVLGILNAVISNNPDEVPYYLTNILNIIQGTKPDLVRDHRFLRLIELTEMG